jgi:hypothetical protein
MRRIVPAISLVRGCALLLVAVASAEGQLRPFQDDSTRRWGYRRADGSVAISPRYTGAGSFRAGRAAVEDSRGFAIIDTSARVLERIERDTVSGTSEPVPAPNPDCLWRNSDLFPSPGMDCYVDQLRGEASVAGDTIFRTRTHGESYSAASFFRVRYGVVVLEEDGYEGRATRLLLPGVTPLQADAWVQKFYNEADVVKTGCSEHWSSGAVRGGAFIQRHYGC